MIAIDKYAYISGLKDANPTAKLLFGGLALAACVCSRSPASFMIVFVVMVVMTVVKGKIPAGYYTKLLTLPICFLCAGVIGIVVNVTTSPLPDDCVLHYKLCGTELFVSQRSLTTALHLVLRAMASISCLYFIILTTPMRDVVYMMKRLRCPGVIVTLTLLGYHFIFLLMDTATVKMKSQLCRGGYRSVKTFPRVFGMLWGSVFVQSFHKADVVYRSLSARGYDGEIRLFPRELRITGKKIGLIAIFITVVLLMNLL